MAKRQGFLGNLLSGLEKTYNPAAAAEFDRLSDERAFQRDKESANIERQFEQQKLLDQEASFQRETEIIGSALSGNIDRAKKLSLMSQLGKGGVKRMTEMEKLLDPKKNYTHVGKNLYEVVDGEVNPEPVIKGEVAIKTPKRISSRYGKHAATGELGLEVFMDDGSPKFIPSMLKEGSTTSGGTAAPKSILDYDPIKFGKTLKPFSKDVLDNDERVEEYRSMTYATDEEKASLRDHINTVAFNNEQTLYEVIPIDTRKHINEFYADMKGLAKKKGSTLKTLVSLNQDALKQQFIDSMVAAKKNKEITSDELRLLSLWAKFKFGYLIESKEDAETTE